MRQEAPGAPQERRQQIAGRLSAVRASIADEAQSCGRSADEVTLIVVTKTRPPSDIRILYDFGVRQVGENRDQEAAEKHAQCADLDLTWHFIGQLQTNKCASVVRYADVVHSVDRPRLVTALSRAVIQAGRNPLTALVQVNLDQDDHEAAGRGGVRPDAAPVLAEAIAQAQGLTLGGVMAVAPLGGDARAAFDRLREVSETITDGHPSATIISAGMSGDFAAAIHAGATHVRMGAAVLGDRPSVR